MRIAHSNHSSRSSSESTAGHFRHTNPTDSTPAFANDSFTRSRESSIDSSAVRKNLLKKIISKRHRSVGATTVRLPMLTGLSYHKLEKMLQRAEIECPLPVEGSQVACLFNQLMMEKLHHRELRPQAVINLLYSYAHYQQNASSMPPAANWATEILTDPVLGDFEVEAFSCNFEAFATGTKEVKKADLGTNFKTTSNNEVQVLSDKEQFWPQLLKDLQSATHSININVFGIQDDSWSREVFDLLIRKARQGVRVRVLADSLGARMHWYFNKSNSDFVQYLRNNGIELILTKDENYRGNFHFDHRKFFVIDGKLAHNTGYTIEDHMRHIHFDMSMRVQGGIVNQMQANFFASWLYFGGELPQAKDNFQLFHRTYFPPSPIRSGSSARLVTNIPNVQHRATETYCHAIANAAFRLRVINEFLSDNKLMRLIEQKANQGVEIDIVYPRVCEWEGYKLIAFEFFDRIKDLPNVNIHLYDGPNNHGWLHTKGIVVDDEYVNFGSNNMDELALYHNYEQNIEMVDATVAQQANAKVFDYAIHYSTAYNEAPSSWRSFKTYFYKLMKKVIEP